MSLHVLRRRQTLPVPRDEAFDFFSDALNLERITPPWLGFRVLTPEPIRMRAGTVIDYRLSLRAVPVRWRTRIALWEPGRRFVDVQLRGPYRFWHHTHEFEDGDGGRTTVMCDTVRYGLPLGPVGRLAHRSFVARDLEAIFDFRREAVGRLVS